MEATTKDLRLHTRELIAATERGEHVVITYRGKPRALLMPLEESAGERPLRNPAFGLWSDRETEETCSVDEHLRSLRQPRRFGC